jgi:hypothetical protein
LLYFLKGLAGKYSIHLVNFLHQKYQGNKTFE